jgi:hypothetical protein
MNQKSNWPTRSMQHEIISGELEKQMSGSKKAEADLAAQSLARRQGRPAPAKPAPTRAKAPEVAVDAPGKVFFTEEPKVGEPEPVMAPPPVEPEPNEPAVEPLMPAPIPEPAPEPAAEPGAEPTPDPAADPMGGAPEPAPEPATEPTPEPAPAPAPQPPKSNDPGEGIQGPHSAATNWKTYTVPAKSNANLARLARAWHGAPAKSTTQPKAVSAAVR